MTDELCRGSGKLFRSGTLSRDQGVAQCFVCDRNCYVDEKGAIEPHPPLSGRNLYKVELVFLSGAEEGDLAYQFERFIEGSCWEGDVRVSLLGAA